MSARRRLVTIWGGVAIVATVLIRHGPAAVACGVMGATALAACCGPGLEAARLDALVALRYE